MKTKLSFAALFMAAVMLLSSCSAFTQQASNSQYYTAGLNVGSALRSLYVQYKQNGKIDMSNASTLLTIASLASNYQTVKSNLTNKEFYKDFANGMVKGSYNTVTNNNVDNIISLLGATDFGGITCAANNNTTTVDNQTSAAVGSALGSILGGMTSLK